MSVIDPERHIKDLYQRIDELEAELEKADRLIDSLEAELEKEETNGPTND